MCVPVGRKVERSRVAPLMIFLIRLTIVSENPRVSISPASDDLFTCVISDHNLCGELANAHPDCTGSVPRGGGSTRDGRGEE